MYFFHKAENEKKERKKGLLFIPVWLTKQASTVGEEELERYGKQAGSYSKARQL